MKKLTKLLNLLRHIVYSGLTNNRYLRTFLIKALQLLTKTGSKNKTNKKMNLSNKNEKKGKTRIFPTTTFQKNYSQNHNSTLLQSTIQEIPLAM